MFFQSYDVKCSATFFSVHSVYRLTRSPYPWTSSTHHIYDVFMHKDAPFGVTPMRLPIYGSN